MSISSPIQSRGTLTSVTATTATGAGTAFPTQPTQMVAMQVTAASTTAFFTQVQVKMEGSLDGTNWFDVGATQTYAAIGTSVYVSTGAFILTQMRANVVTHTATGTIEVSLVAV